MYVIGKSKGKRSLQKFTLRNLDIIKIGINKAGLKNVDHIFLLQNDVKFIDQLGIC